MQRVKTLFSIMESGDPYFIELNNFIDLQGQKKGQTFVAIFSSRDVSSTFISMALDLYQIN